MARINDKSFSATHQVAALSNKQPLSKKMALSQKGVQTIIAGSLPKPSPTSSLKGRVTSAMPQGTKELAPFAKLKKPTK